MTDLAKAQSDEVPVHRPSDDELRRVRKIFHELSNVFTGVLLGAGLLRQEAQEKNRVKFSDEICEIAQRGAALIREARSVLVPVEERIDGVMTTGVCEITNAEIVSESDAFDGEVVLQAAQKEKCDEG